MMSIRKLRKDENVFVTLRKNVKTLGKGYKIPYLNV